MGTCNFSYMFLTWDEIYIKILIIMILWVGEKAAAAQVGLKMSKKICVYTVNFFVIVNQINLFFNLLISWQLKKHII